MLLAPCKGRPRRKSARSEISRERSETVRGAIVRAGCSPSSAGAAGLLAFPGRGLHPLPQMGLNLATSKPNQWSPNGPQMGSQLRSRPPFLSRIWQFSSRFLSGFWQLGPRLLSKNCLLRFRLPSPGPALALPLGIKMPIRPVLSRIIMLETALFRPYFLPLAPFPVRCPSAWPYELHRASTSGGHVT